MRILGGTILGHMVTPPHDDERAAPAGDAMAVVDVRGTVTGWSEGARLLTGYTAPEVTGRPAAELLDGTRPRPGGNCATAPRPYPYGTATDGLWN